MKKKLLIIEDDENTRELLQMEFVDSGYEVLAVKSAFIGLEAFKENNIDLVLLDMKLPGMDCGKRKQKTNSRSSFLNMKFLQVR